MVKVVERPVRSTFRRIALGVALLALAAAVILMLTDPAGTPTSATTTTTWPVTCNDEGGCLIPPLVITREEADRG